MQTHRARKEDIRCWLGVLLKKLRKANSIRLDVLAQELGISSKTLFRVEQGKAPVELDLLFAYQDLFGVSVTDIIAQIESKEK